MLISSSGEAYSLRPSKVTLATRSTSPRLKNNTSAECIACYCRNNVTATTTPCPTHAYGHTSVFLCSGHRWPRGHTVYRAIARALHELRSDFSRLLRTLSCCGGGFTCKIYS